MRVNNLNIAQRRQQKGWTQEHLAAAAGLSKRTVQRVEATGAVSAETAQAICAALELKIETILQAPKNTSVLNSYPTALIGAVAVIFFIVGLFVGLIV
jgi:transcriptional regulator with XRE-family HTH domain